jgi:hypothetical protein
MTWTTEKPTKAGLYFVKLGNDKAILHIILHNREARIVTGAYVSGELMTTHIPDGVEWCRVEEPKACEWEKDRRRDAWDTECDNVFLMDYYTLSQGGIKYCPYCGGEVIEKLELEE